MTPRTLLLLAAICIPPALGQREDNLIAHWRFAASQYAGETFQGVYGGPPLGYITKPTYIGTGESQALALPQDRASITCEGRLLSDSLPQRRFSVEGWVAVDKPAKYGGFLGAIEDNGEEEYGWMLGFKDKHFCFALASEGLGRLHYLVAPQAFVPGRWYHVAGVYDGEEQILFVDGVEVAKFSEHAGPIRYQADHIFAAGSYKDANEDYRMVGGLYELRLWGKPLTQQLVNRRFKELRDKMPAPQGGTTISGFSLPKPPSISELQPAINQAIDRGVQWLLRRQHRDGSFESHHDGYPAGMTALGLYTLVKQGIPPTHPGVQNGLRYLRRNPPKKTYSAGCLLLLLAALKDHEEGADERRDWAAEIVDLLVDWENGGRPGAYGYPGGTVDLSCTQYAALGLWAADKLGVRTPKDLWQRLVLNAVQLHQLNVLEVDWTGEDAQKRTGKRRLAGFSYRGGDPKHPSTGSMTAAGLCIIGTARDTLGDGLGRKVSRPATEGERMGFEWLEENWDVKRSPGGGQHLYYLYGVERLGAIYKTDHIGPHDWYRDGAEQLLKMQKGPGNWDNEPNTCFALLFLSKATGASATGPGITSKPKGWVSEAGDVHFRATGEEKLTLWLTGFAPKVLEGRKGQAADRDGLRVLKVEYLANGAVIQTVPGNPNKPWAGERYPSQHTFRRLGKQKISCRVHAVAKGDPVENHGPPQVLNGGSVEVEILLNPETFQAAHTPTTDKKLQPLELDITLASASTEANEKNNTAAKSTDGLQASRWLSTPKDSLPWLRIELREPVRAGGVRISPATSSLTLVGSYEPLGEVDVLVNGEDTYQLGMPADGVTWGVLLFDKETRVRSVEVRVKGRKETGAKSVGISELELLGSPPRRRRGR